MDNIHIVTVATEDKLYYKYLKESCKKFGKDIDTLGLNKKWEGYAWKFNLTKKYLEDLNPTDIVVFVDGYDVVCVNNLNNLEKEFNKIKNREKCKIIVGHDKVIPISGKIFQYLHFDKCKDAYLNSGSYIGTAGDLLEILRKMYEMNSDFKADDQNLMTKYCNLNNKDIYIDNNNEIFCVLANPFDEISDEFNISNGKLYYKDGSSPFFIHGPASTYLDGIIKKIGVKHTDEDNIKNELANVFYKKKLFDVMGLVIYEHKDTIIMIILIIIFLVFLYKRHKN